MYTIIDVNGSKVCHHSSPSIWTSEYYFYCLRLLVAVLQRSQKSVNIIFGDIACDFHNSNNTIKIDIQSEHTLVKLGGRSVDEVVSGNIDLLDGTGKYLIRIPNYNYYSRLDATIEYSRPNIANVQTNSLYTDYIKRAIYIAPTIYDVVNFQMGNRSATITLGNSSDRRIEFAWKTKTMGLDISNIQNVLSKHSLKSMYNDTKIMVNVHQTDHHHTFEELRVLPALCNGVIIVSERVPLKEVIPYVDSIVWSSYNDLAQTVRDVQNNYNDYFQRIFTHKLEEQIIALRQDNINNLADLIDKIT